MLLVARGRGRRRRARALPADVQQADVIRVREPGHDVLLLGGVETVRAVGSWLEARYAG